MHKCSNCGCAAKTKRKLKEHELLGEIGDIVNVKPGYARNFLFPRGIAVRSSKRNVALAAEQKSK